MRKSKTIAELTETVKSMTDSAIAAGLDVPAMAVPVNDIPETVPEITETVNEALPVAIDLEPKTLSLVQEFSWNFEEIKTALASKIAQYAGLVVTDENLKDMEKTQKEIVSLRVKISKFQLQVKRELAKPYGNFELQIKDLSGLVESVERPIKDQLDVYENKRRAEKSIMVQAMINELSQQMGLEEKYSQQIVVADNYLNRTTTKKEITEDLQMKVAWFLDIQSQDRQVELFKAQKAEMAKLLCQSLSAGLATPITYEEIQCRIETMADILAVKAYIENEVSRRKELEARAAAQAAERAARATAPPPPRPSAGGPPPLPPQAPIRPPMAPPMPPAAVELWDADLHISATTVVKMEKLKAFMAADGIQYVFSNHTRRN